MKNLYKIIITFLLAFVISIILSGCAGTQHIQSCIQTGESPGGFFWGFWNGWTAVISFIGHLFDNNIAVYDVNNNGGWYDFGFLIGIGAFGRTLGGLFGNNSDE